MTKTEPEPGCSVEEVPAGPRGSVANSSPSRMPPVLKAAIIGAPVLGWISPLLMLAVAAWGVTKRGWPQGALQELRGPSRWLPVIAVSWWLVLLAGDLLAATPGAWWQDLRFLLVILPACALLPVLANARITYMQVGRWAMCSAWITMLVIAAEYLVAVHGAGMVHHRPRGLSGNALLVSSMLVPMILLAWLSLLQHGNRAWLYAWATHAAGVLCLGLILGARTSTLMTLALTPLPLLWLRHGNSGSRPMTTLMTVATMLALFTVATAAVSAWHADRWSALLGVVAGADPSSTPDYGIASRAQHWPAAWQAVLERPWLGYGFLQEMSVLQQQLPAGTQVLPTAHQQYLSFLLWSGGPGLITGCLLVALPLILALGRGRCRYGLYAATALSLPMMLHGLTDTIFDDLRIISYHLMMALLLNSATQPGHQT